MELVLRKLVIIMILLSPSQAAVGALATRRKLATGKLTGFCTKICSDIKTRRPECVLVGRVRKQAHKPFTHRRGGQSLKFCQLT